MHSHSVVAALSITLSLSSQTFAQSPAQTPIRTVNRIMEQATWGPTQTPDPILQRFGFKGWFGQQLLAPVSTYSDQPQLNAMGNSNTNMVPTQTEFFQNAVSGKDQLRQRVAFALSEIWVISELEVNNASAFPPLFRIFQADAFGNYEQLMKDVTLNPGMGRFLNMVNNDKANAAKGTAANENYGREIMQLFTLGLTELNMDGTPVTSNGVPVPTYDQSTVTAVSRAFTGWTYPPVPGKTTTGHNPTYYLGPMVPVQGNHDTGQKVLFPGYTLPANQTAEADLVQAIHAIFMQPTMAPFVSKLLIQHLTTSSPSPAYVQRVADVFANNGQGVRGDLKAVVKQILFDPDARAGDAPGTVDAAAYGHMREPVLFVTNLLRGMNGTVAATSNTASAAASLGQNLFSPPSVFSYFSPSYRTPTGLLAPEFQLYSTQSAATRANLVNSAVYGGKFDAGTTFDVSSFVTAAANPTNLIEMISQVFFHDDLSDNVKSAMTTAMNAVTAPADKARAALYIALTSGEYQVIH